MTRPLTFAQRAFKAPLGLLYFFALGILALPVLIYMTVLFYALAAVKTLLPSARRERRAARVAAAGETEERVA
ncbi:MAG: hypothetical protein ACRD6R_12900 [Candidatus Polarisedimenticolia bacterium]